MEVVHLEDYVYKIRWVLFMSLKEQIKTLRGRARGGGS